MLPYLAYTLALGALAWVVRLTQADTDETDETDEWGDR